MSWCPNYEYCDGWGYVSGYLFAKGWPLLQHDQQAPNWHGSHFVEVTEGSLLRKIVGMDKFKVNSYHHQALRNMPEGFIVSGVASDGVIEAFESTKHPFVMGIQWHPESLLTKGDASSHAIFEAFMNACMKVNCRVYCLSPLDLKL